MQTTIPTTRPSRLILACSIASLLALSSGAMAASDWVGNTSGDFNDLSNWSFNPTNQDVYIGISGNNGGPAPFRATLSSNLAFGIVDLQIARGGGPAIFNHTAGIAATGSNNWVDVGTAGGNGTYNLADTTTTGGTLTGFGLGSGTIRAGGGDGGNGRLYVGGVDFSNAGGTGVFNVNTTGTVQVDNDLVIGTGGGTGTMNVDAGIITTGGWNFIGKDDNGSGNGTLNMSGGTLTNTGRTYVGLNNSTGKIVMSGNATYNNTADSFRLGHNNLANATIASISMSGGTMNTANFWIGGNDEVNGKGKLTLSGTTALVNANGEIWVGDNGAASYGELNLSAGTVQANNWIAVGRAGATGVLNLSGTGILKKTGGAGSHIIIGSIGGNGTVFQTGGQMFTDGGGNILLGENSNSGTWNISAGIASADQVRLGAIGAGDGFVNLSGTGSITTGLVAIAATNDGDGTFTQTGGTLTATDVDVKASGGASVGIYNLSGGQLIMDGAMSLDNGSFGFTGGKITRSNAGVITFNGNLTIGSNAATLKLDTNKTFDVNGAFNITTGVAFEVNGITIPSALPGVLQTGSFTLGTDDSIIGTFSQLTTTLPGLVDLAGATFISEVAGETGGFDPGVDRVYWVEEDAGVVSLQYSVPEPTTFGLLALAGLGLASRRRRK